LSSDLEQLVPKPIEMIGIIVFLIAYSNGK
jgi:hypothetical protein